MKLLCHGLGVAIIATLMISTVHASEWVMRADESTLEFVGMQQGSPFRGRFQSFTANILFDPDTLDDARIEVAVDIVSFDASSDERHLIAMSPDWFGVDAFPQAHFVATEFRDLGAGNFEAVGQLTIKDIATPLVLPFSLRIEGDVAHVSSELVLSRMARNLGVAVPDDFVSNEIRLAITLVADRR